MPTLSVNAFQYWIRIQKICWFLLLSFHIPIFHITSSLLTILIYKLYCDYICIQLHFISRNYFSMVWISFINWHILISILNRNYQIWNKWLHGNTHFTNNRTLTIHSIHTNGFIVVILCYCLLWSIWTNCTLCNAVI